MARVVNVNVPQRFPVQAQVQTPDFGFNFNNNQNDALLLSLIDMMSRRSDREARTRLDERLASIQEKQAEAGISAAQSEEFQREVSSISGQLGEKREDFNRRFQNSQNKFISSSNEQFNKGIKKTQALILELSRLGNRSEAQKETFMANFPSRLEATLRGISNPAAKIGAGSSFAGAIDNVIRLGGDVGQRLNHVRNEHLFGLQEFQRLATIDSESGVPLFVRQAMQRQLVEVGDARQKAFQVVQGKINVARSSKGDRTLLNQAFSSLGDVDKFVTEFKFPDTAIDVPSLQTVPVSAGGTALPSAPERGGVEIESGVSKLLRGLGRAADVGNTFLFGGRGETTPGGTFEVSPAAELSRVMGLGPPGGGPINEQQTLDVVVPQTVPFNLPPGPGVEDLFGLGQTDSKLSPLLQSRPDLIGETPFNLPAGPGIEDLFGLNQGGPDLSSLLQSGPGLVGETPFNLPPGPSVSDLFGGGPRPSRPPFHLRPPRAGLGRTGLTMGPPSPPAVPQLTPGGSEEEKRAADVLRELLSRQP